MPAGTLRTLPALGPADDCRVGTGDRFSITTIMESLAETPGGLEDLLEVMQGNLVSGYAFVRIAQACRRYDHDELALERAQGGVETFPDEWRLAELICDIHSDAGRRDEALATGRDLFIGDLRWSVTGGWLPSPRWPVSGPPNASLR